MPGILAALSAKELANEAIFEKMISSLLHEPFYCTFKYNSSQAFVSLICLSESDLNVSKCVRYDGAVSVFIYGSIFNSEFRKTIADVGKATFIAQKYLCEDLSFLRNLNGEFNILICDEQSRQFHIVNDRYGHRPWYLFHDGGELIVSHEIKAILEHPLVHREIDLNCLVGMLQFNKMRLGNRTLFHGIEVMPPASILTWDNGNLKWWQYWAMKNILLASTEKDASGINSQLIANEATELYRDAVVRRLPSSKSNVVLSLSGGLDSRSLAAVMHEKKVNTVALTYGIPESDEVRLAQEVTKQLGMEHHIVPLYPEDYIESAPQAAILTDELDIFVQGVQQKVNRYARTLGNLLFTGLDLDVTLGGIYIDSQVLAAQNTDDVINLLRSRWGIFDTKLLRDTLQPPLQNTLPEVEQEVRSLLEEMAPLPFSNRYDLAILQFSMRRIIMLRYKHSRFYIDTASPMYDNYFADYVLALPLSVKASHRLFWHFINRLSPKLAAITYQRTMLPATAPVEFWKRGAQIEAEREKLYWDIWAETSGEVFVPYKRYYTNFDEWIRMNPTWQRFLRDLLLSKETICTREYFQRDVIEKLLSEHMSGSANHRQRIIYVASIELFLRTFFQ